MWKISPMLPVPVVPVVPALLILQGGCYGVAAGGTNAHAAVIVCVETSPIITTAAVFYYLRF